MCGMFGATLGSVLLNLALAAAFLFGVPAEAARRYATPNSGVNFTVYGVRPGEDASEQEAEAVRRQVLEAIKKKHAESG